MELYSTLFKRYLHENKALHTQQGWKWITLNIVIYVAWDKG